MRTEPDRPCSENQRLHRAPVLRRAPGAALRRYCHQVLSVATYTLVAWLSAQHQYKVIGPPAAGRAAPHVVGVHTATTRTTTPTPRTTAIRAVAATGGHLAARHVTLAHDGPPRPPLRSIPPAKSELSLRFVKPLRLRAYCQIATTCSSAMRGTTGARLQRTCTTHSKLWG